MELGQNIGRGRLHVIDAIRAFAVIAVVLYHVFPHFAPGGFIGVDIFFAISGFIITLKYFESLKNEGNFKDFFIRRIRRLLPASAVLVITVMAASYFILDPVHLRSFGTSLAAQGLYIQNIVFWLQGDYFDNSYIKPLLHTWSLGVEEQFYLIFPLFILICRKNLKLGLLILLAGAAISLAGGLIISGLSPKTPFYLVFFRIWEFAAGILLALLFVYRPRYIPTRPRTANALLMLGLAMMTATVFLWPEAAPFPGSHAYVAIAGAMLVFLSQMSLSAGISNVLRNSALQYCGRISYSWYLWHWPILSFYFVQYGKMPGLVSGIALAVIGFLISVASYELVEQGRYASIRDMARNRPVTSLLSFCGLCLTLGGAAALTNGAIFRYDGSTQRVYAAQMDRTTERCGLAERLRDYQWEFCRISDVDQGPGVLLLGDSHAAAAKHMLIKLANESGTRLFMTKRSCQPVSLLAETGYCSRAWWRNVIVGAHDAGVSRIIVVGRYPFETTEADYREGFELMAGSGFDVIIQRSTPEGKWFDPALRLSGDDQAKTFDDRLLTNYRKRRRAQFSAADFVVAQHPNIRFLDPIPYLCKDRVCPRDLNGYPLYADYNHLSVTGEYLLEPMFRQFFEKVPRPMDTKAL